MYNEYVIKEVDSIKKYSKPLLSGTRVSSTVNTHTYIFYQIFECLRPVHTGTMEKTSVIVGDLTMDSETILENVKIIENEIKSSFRWATGKKGKSAENDKLTFVVSVQFRLIILAYNRLMLLTTKGSVQEI